jgi:hypothetical protein
VSQLFEAEVLAISRPARGWWGEIGCVVTMSRCLHVEVGGKQLEVNGYFGWVLCEEDAQVGKLPEVNLLP